jgi:hypothetical protein
MAVGVIAVLSPILSPILPSLSLHVVQQDEQGVLFRLGRVIGIVDVATIDSGVVVTLAAGGPDHQRRNHDRQHWNSVGI